MANKLTIPIPRDPVGESFVWRDWFQKLSNTVYGTIATQDANNVNITGGIINNIDFTGISITKSTIDSTPIGNKSASTGHFTSIKLDKPLVTSAPVTYTANFTVAATDYWVINNKPSSTCTATLPAPSTNKGRVLYFQNYQNQTLVSASSNVVPLVGGSAGTAILIDVAGDTCTLVSDGSNWLMTQYVPNNVLLLE